MRLLNKKRADIRCISASQRLEVLQNLIERGYVWHRGSGKSFGEGATPEEIEKKYPFSTYTTVVAEKRRAEGARMFGSGDCNPKCQIEAASFLKLNKGVEK